MRRHVITTSTVAALALALVASACKRGGSFGLSSEDNNPQNLQQALATEQKPPVGKPLNSSGTPMAFLVAIQPKRLIAWDLAAGKQRWSVEADVTSRIVVGSKQIAAREGKDKIVARDIDSGKVLWTHGLPGGEFLGAAADGDRVFYVVKDAGGGKASWSLIALGPGGGEIWRQTAPGTLGAPAARGGLVFMPFLTQWLAILDASTGKQIARIRQTDEALNFVRTTSDGVFYGSKGVFLLDENSYKGTREGATYGTAKLPKEFVRTFYHFDAFNSVQAGYSAFDRNRILWRASGKDGELAFQDDLVTVFTFRFFFAFDAKSGALAWAHQHPRHDIVSVAHTGGALVYVSLEGELGALDAKSGARLFETKLGARVTGATFDAEGFAPAGGGEASDTAAALAAMVADKDSRFQAVKLFAIEALGGLADPAASKALLDVVLDEKTPPPVFQKAAAALIARKDAQAVPLYLAALEVPYDYIQGTRPRAVDVLARALGAIGKPEAAPLLVRHLLDPETPLASLKDIADALGKCGNPAALPGLRAFVLTYRTDPAFAADSGAVNAAMNALLALGSGAERELVAFVADDPRSQPAVAEYARYALTQSGAGKEPAGGK